MRKAAFEIKDNHKKLLLNHKDGVIAKSDIKNLYQGQVARYVYKGDAWRAEIDIKLLEQYGL